MKLFIVIPGVLWLAGIRAWVTVILFISAFVGLGYLLGRRVPRRLLAPARNW